MRNYPQIQEKNGKLEIDHSVRKYDGARLTWHRVFGPLEWGPWILVKVEGAKS